MSPDQLKDFFGTQAAIGRALGVQQPTVAEWFANGVVPDSKQYQAQIATNGVLMADKPALRSTPQCPVPAEQNKANHSAAPVQS